MNHLRYQLKLVLFLILLLECSRLSANENCEPVDGQSVGEECVEIGKWTFGLTLGAGIRTNPLIEGDDIPLLVLPSIQYYGENFFVNNLDIGYTFLETDSWTLNALTTPSYDRVYFNRWDISNIIVDITTGASSPGFNADSDSLGDQQAEIHTTDLEDREITWLAGIEINRKIDSGDFQLSLLKDVTDTHNGTEVRAAWAFPIGQSNWGASLGFTWKDSKATNYYYGVRESEVTDDRVAYSPGSSFTPFIRAFWQKKSGDNGHYRFSLELQKLDSSISDSPIIDETTTINIFIGKQFTF